MHFTSTGWRATAAFVALATLTPAHGADEDAEREALARLAHEIEVLRVLVDEAETQADAAARVRFRYDWLRRDLARMREGILDHVYAPRAQPRTVEPLHGDYRR